jgi:hypothetical protein
MRVATLDATNARETIITILDAKNITCPQTELNC